MYVLYIKAHGKHISVLDVKNSLCAGQGGKGSGSVSRKQFWMPKYMRATYDRSDSDTWEEHHFALLSGIYLEERYHRWQMGYIVSQILLYDLGILAVYQMQAGILLTRKPKRLFHVPRYRDATGMGFMRWDIRFHKDLKYP